jgi:hypothetical protein
MAQQDRYSAAVHEAGHTVVAWKDAANFIMKLTKAEQRLEEWQTATSWLRKVEGRLCISGSAC